ncbi:MULTISPECIES: hypothetical protein [unclassified Leptolyngbya]|uniref:hypothetical protein n=1 Tax=unclassified Leptolyngbya TaxID=2650499 RepID=UPI0016894EA9|nr:MULTISPECIES: hypothetical protein [unclassified Leptolyngbya]MBD1910404.1 hypothetical protein [Leptolyngbya sp. FACHB-8]MBD2157800.1 hypothetical protein [Leptolyngbya sp. FACHB-16]
MTQNANSTCHVITRYLRSHLGVVTRFTNDISWQKREQQFDDGDIDSCWICGLPYPTLGYFRGSFTQRKGTRVRSLLNLHINPEGKQIQNDEAIACTTVSNSDYDPICNMALRAETISNT